MTVRMAPELRIVGAVRWWGARRKRGIEMV